MGRNLENAQRLSDALEEFGAPIGVNGAKRFSDLDRQMVRIGVPPNMVDILNFAGSKPFPEVFSRSLTGVMEGLELAFPSVEDLIEMKKVAGRKKDLADIEALGG